MSIRWNAPERMMLRQKKETGSARYAARCLSNDDVSYAWPLRSSLPGVAPVHRPSEKVSSPFTMIER
jgi:hypothetical protein